MIVKGEAVSLERREAFTEVGDSSNPPGNDGLETAPPSRPRFNLPLTPLMKTSPFLLAILGLCLGFSSLPGQTGPEASAEPQTEESAAEPEAETPPPTPAEARAVELYKGEMMSIRTWLAEWVDSAHQNQASAYRIPVLLSEKLAKVPTKGLPAKIAEAFAALRKNIDAHALLLKDLPKDDAEAMEWMETKLTDKEWSAQCDDLMASQSELQSTLAYAADAYGAGKESDLFQSTELSQFEDRWVVILGAYKNFEEAKSEAVKVAEATDTLFTLRDMIYDEKGLRYPDDFDDEVYAGQYAPRTSNYWSVGEEAIENHISVEMSSGYEGFEPGYFIGVGMIAETPEEAAKMADQLKKHAPGTYVKKTVIFYGCSR